MKVAACAVCLTDLHVVEGDLPDPKPEVVPGHQIVGVVEAVGEGVAASGGRRPGRRALAGVDGRALPVLPRRNGEPLRRAALHRLHGRRRLRRVRRGSGRLRLSGACRIRRRRGRAAAVLRADRVPVVAHREPDGFGQAGATGPVRVRQLRADRDPGRARRRSSRSTSTRGERRDGNARSGWARRGRAAATSCRPTSSTA